MASTRKQMFLEKISDASAIIPVPVTSEEEILKEIGVNGGGGGGANLPTVTVDDAGKGLVVNDDGQWGVSYDQVAQNPVAWEFNGTGEEFVDAFEWAIFNFPNYSGGTTPYMFGIIDSNNSMFDTNHAVEVLSATPTDFLSFAEFEEISGAYSTLDYGYIPIGQIPSGFMSGDFSTIGGYEAVTGILLFGEWTGTLSDDLVTLRTAISNVNNIHLVVNDIRKSRKIVPVVIAKSFEGDPETGEDIIISSVNLSYNELLDIYNDNMVYNFYTKLPVFFDNGRLVSGDLTKSLNNGGYIEITTNDTLAENNGIYTHEMKYRVYSDGDVRISSNKTYQLTADTPTEGYVDPNIDK